MNDELVLILEDNSEMTLYRDQVNAVPLHGSLVER
jgi:hypothetical protein